MHVVRKSNVDTDPDAYVDSSTTVFQLQKKSKVGTNNKEDSKIIGRDSIDRDNVIDEED